MADAAHAILVRPARETTGNFFIDEEVLRAEGVTDFSKYAPGCRRDAGRRFLRPRRGLRAQRHQGGKNLSAEPARRRRLRKRNPAGEEIRPGLMSRRDGTGQGTPSKYLVTAAPRFNGSAIEPREPPAQLALATGATSGVMRRMATRRFSRSRASVFTLR